MDLIHRLSSNAVGGTWDTKSNPKRINEIKKFSHHNRKFVSLQCETLTNAVREAFLYI